MVVVVVVDLPGSFAEVLVMGRVRDGGRTDWVVPALPAAGERAWERGTWTVDVRIAVHWDIADADADAEADCRHCAWHGREHSSWRPGW